MLGMTELVIIVGLIIALSFSFRMFRTVKRINATSSRVTPDQMNMEALADRELQSYLPHQKQNAAQRYQVLTGHDRKAAQQTIEYLMEHPELLGNTAEPE